MLAYFDLYSGAAGDMILAALLDAGLDIERLRSGLATLPIAGYRLSARPVMKGAIGATSFHVEVDTDQPHRHLADILDLVARSSLPGTVKDQASAVFTMLGQAEARVHRVPLTEVHFHEVGAIDSIVDIVGACLGLHLLGVTHVACSPFPIAQGSLQVQHGRLPMPGPATLEILAAAQAPIIPPPSPVTGELVTPTGAALLCTLASFDQPTMRLHAVGYGAGNRDLPHPNVLRMLLGDTGSRDLQEGDGVTVETVTLLETNIDDMNPQVLGYLVDRLREEGALDVYWISIGMKKNRPGTMLNVLCKTADAPRFGDLLLRETTTLGVRVQTVRRVVAGRSVAKVETPFGEVRVKVKWLHGKPVSAAPEYDDCVQLAQRHNRPLRDVLSAAAQAAAALLQ